MKHSFVVAESHNPWVGTYELYESVDHCYKNFRRGMVSESDLYRSIAECVCRWLRTGMSCEVAYEVCRDAMGEYFAEDWKSVVPHIQDAFAL